MKVEEGKTLFTVGDCSEEGLLELSVSRMKKWNTCQKAHDYRYVEKLRPKEKARPLTLGSLVHKCLETRANKGDWIRVIKEFKKNEWSKIFEEEQVELGDIPGDCFRIMRGYTRYYKDSDERLETIAAEVPFSIRIPKTPVVLVGIIDLIVRDKTTGDVWCYEHKTAKKDIPSEEFRMTDVQTTLYMYVMEKLAPMLNYDAKKLRGVVVDYLKTSPPTIPSILKDGTVSKRKITCDYDTFYDCLIKNGDNPEDYTDVLEHMKTNVFYKRVPFTKSVSLTKNTLREVIITAKQILALSGKCPSRNLNWTCDSPRCEFRDLCLAEMQGLDTETLKQIKYERKEEENIGENKESEGNQ